MPASPAELSLTYYAPGLTAELGSTGERCWFRVEVASDHAPQANHVKVEVLYQPRDQHGFARGLARVVFAAQWLLEDKPQRVAYDWLPRGITPALAKQCHFRVTPVRIGDAADQAANSTPSSEG